MTNIAAVENKLSSVRKYIKILENFKDYSQIEIQNDITVRGAVERYLYLAAQSIIDLAEAVIAFKGFRKPATMSESFKILTEEKIITSALAQEMIKLVGFRNIMAHDYEKINYDILYDILHNKAGDIESFLKVIQSLN
ncbi:MAG: type VII toxin-antitoxin system HepT family RNase toxin [Thermodesulfobacteriota bacterium]